MSFKKIVFTLFAIALFTSPNLAMMQTLKSGQSLGIETKSKSVYLFDISSGQVIFSKNPDKLVPLASLTKLMTAIIVDEQRPDWKAKVKFTANDKKGGSIPYLIPGETVTRSDLWNLMLVASSNDAVAALVRSLDFTTEEFVKLMNQKTAELGLKQCFFKDPTGLNPGNVGTAREVAIVAQAAFSHLAIKNSLLKTYYDFLPQGKKLRRVWATDKLLASFLNKHPYYIIGGKTGYLEESQYNLVMAVGKKVAGKVYAASLDNNLSDRKIMGVILGSPSPEIRFQEMKSIIYWGLEKVKL